MTEITDDNQSFERWIRCGFKPILKGNTNLRREVAGDAQMPEREKKQHNKEKAVHKVTVAETRPSFSAAQVKQMSGDHKRNTGPMLASLRCGAKTRSGGPCRSPSVHGKRRCRMHGGALGSGVPRGNKNALKHGRYTREAIAERAHVRELVRQARKLLLQI